MEENQEDQIEAKTLEPSGIPKRPWSIYLVSIWLFTNSLLYMYSLWNNYTLIYDGGFFEGTFFEFIKDYYGIVEFLYFLTIKVVLMYLAIGIFLGLGWGRRGYLWLVGIEFIINISRYIYRIIQIQPGGPWFFYVNIFFEPFRFLLLPIFALWYFRQPSILCFFGVNKLEYPKWVTLPFPGTKIPLDTLLTTICFV